jgi:alkanesulfonate monooxygenase SsuD/methylene tetrahydromethanopterin reductase-like flavin-dependent oxidoreductase (luciferase family)
MPALTFGLKPPQQHTSLDILRRVWMVADEAGFDGAWVFDHFAPMGRVRTGDVFEAWTLLAAMAQATTRLRIGALVTGNTNRHPGVLAKMASTVDHLSSGRLDMGIGAGGDLYVDTMLGLPLIPSRERIRRLDEACEVLKLLWSEPLANYDGTFYQLKNAEHEPKPVQRPHPPIWMGSSGEKYGLRVVAKHADVWMNANMAGADVEELKRLGRVLDQHCADVGRDPADIRRAIQFRLPPEPEDLLREAERYAEAGFTDIILMQYQVGDAALGAAEAAAEVLPKLRTLG